MPPLSLIPLLLSRPVTLLTDCVSCDCGRTGTTLIMIATDAFDAYQKATGATMDNTTGLLSLSESQFDKLESLFFNIGGGAV